MGVVILLEGVCACASTILRFAAVFVQTCLWYGVRVNREGKGSLPHPLLSSLSSPPSPSPSLPLTSCSPLPPASITSLPLLPSPLLVFTLFPSPPSSLSLPSLPSPHPPLPFILSSPLPSLPPSFPSPPSLLPSPSPPIPAPSPSPLLPSHSPSTFLQMEAQWELMKSFEDFLSEVEKSLEDLLPVEADLPKLDRQRTAIEVGRVVMVGKEV